MHASLKQLLSRRDCEPMLVRTADHIENCPRCAAEVEQLNRMRNQLRDLRAIEPPEQAWQAIRASLESKPKPRLSWHFVAAAAVGALAVMPLFWLMRQEKLTLSTQQQLATTTDEVPATTPAVDTDTLVSRSQELEQALHTLPQRPAVERAATSVVIDALQQRIQLLDSQLFYSSQAGMSKELTQSLWGERVELLSSLVNVRYAEAARAGYLSANINATGEYR